VQTDLNLLSLQGHHGTYSYEMEHNRTAKFLHSYKRRHNVNPLVVHTGHDCEQVPHCCFIVCSSVFWFGSGKILRTESFQNKKSRVPNVRLYSQTSILNKN
jgi:hypothetical protein